MIRPGGPVIVLVPGAGSDTWYLRPLRDELSRLGYRSVAVDLPSADPDANLDDYTRLIVDTCQQVHTPVLVAHSFGTFSASIAATDPSVAALTIVAPMIPAPGETGADWWDTTGHADAVQHDPDDPTATFFHDVATSSIAAVEQHSLDQSARPFADPWPLHRWPDLPTQIILGRHDRFFPLAFQERLVAERIGIRPVVIDGGHLVPLTQPGAVAAHVAEFVGRCVNPATTSPRAHGRDTTRPFGNPADGAG